MKKAIAAITGVIAAATTVSAAGFTIEDAKDAALKEANVKEEQVIFKQAETDMDDGVTQFDVEMRLADGTEYEYELRASDSAILDKDIDRD